MWKPFSSNSLTKITIFLQGGIWINFSRPLFTIIFRPKIVVVFIQNYRFHFEGKNDIWISLVRRVKWSAKDKMPNKSKVRRCQINLKWDHLNFFQLPSYAETPKKVTFFWAFWVCALLFLFHAYHMITLGKAFGFPPHLREQQLFSENSLELY